MSYKELKTAFDKACWTADGQMRKLSADESQYWMLRLLFEINGNLDSLAVAYRELVDMQKARNGITGKPGAVKK